jgi:transcriptional regulator with XRE-family HTH domain
MTTPFAERLNRLFDEVYPPGRRPYTAAEVVAGLQREGATMSTPYLSQLRSGKRTNPSPAAIADLAKFFRISPAYFTDSEYYETLSNELTYLATMRNAVTRHIVSRALGLSADGQQALIRAIDDLRHQERLDDVG